MPMHPAFTAAERLAPAPQRRDDATRDQWIRVHAANALAAHAAFRDAIETLPPNPERGSRPDLGYLMLIATSATAAALVLVVQDGDIGRHLWDLTPEAGALNGEYIDWLAETLDAVGINPADIDPTFEAAYFRSASRPAPPDVQVWRTFTGAEYASVREIPCSTISNGYLVDADGETMIREDHPAIAAEIDRRGRAVYRDHGYGHGHESVLVMGCDHSATDGATAA